MRLELLTRSKDGNRRYYAANRAHPLYPELHAIVLKTSGLRDVLAEKKIVGEVTHRSRIFAAQSYAIARLAAPWQGYLYGIHMIQ